MTTDTTPRPETAHPVPPAHETFPVEGMTCASCVNRIEKHLKKLDGVLDARVNLATEKATVEYVPGTLGLQDFARAVEAAGYKIAEERPTTRQAAFGVTGMTCASCVNRIQKSLRKLPGVVSADVNLATEKATVQYDPALVVSGLRAGAPATWRWLPPRPRRATPG